MTTNSEQAKTRGYMDPMVEALIKELLDNPPHTKTANSAIKAALTEELMASLLPSARPMLPKSPIETALLAEALAPALAEALMPALTKALAPALQKALESIVAPNKKNDQESASKNNN
ncbi:hypothetical protein [Dictyobacter kobayashii]|uniref:Uncharacterized protein n=1 Tax=Dictyobacter kobayashii TaxID=2014872 RepID=A0A402ANJ6_9CHLR|nr:hypothetical protein [Dictyobacter kobayashii]GCE20768.1 hypothetical protein KDK_45680 [Dictyobacter kobayashii]